tara:strand:- start:791 stop:1027 length:237 start_codon:yes stop_codon:yes gene_type:complete
MVTVLLSEITRLIRKDMKVILSTVIIPIELYSVVKEVGGQVVQNMIMINQNIYFLVGLGMTVNLSKLVPVIGSTRQFM